jgi:hypothetical protein
VEEGGRGGGEKDGEAESVSEVVTDETVLTSKRTWKHAVGGEQKIRMGVDIRWEYGG